MTLLDEMKDSSGKYPSYAWPGGYPIYYLMDDGETLCPTCMNDSTNPIHFDGQADGWRVEAPGINWEDTDMICCHCNRKIESAYGDNG
jgi:hypothetical protein